MLLLLQDYVLWNAVSVPLPHVTLLCYSEEVASKTSAVCTIRSLHEQLIRPIYFIGFTLFL